MATADKKATNAQQAFLAGLADRPEIKGGRFAQERGVKGKPRLEEQQAMGLLGSLDTGICIFDRHGTVTYCNGSFARLAGQSVRKLVGRKLRKNALWGQYGQKDEFRELFARSRESQQAVALRAVPVEKGGTRYWDLELRPFISRSKKYEGMGLLIEDVTASAGKENAAELLRRYYAAALLRASPQELLEEAVRLLCRFSACPSVQVLILDRYRGGVLKAASVPGPGLWDDGQKVTQAFIEGLFNRPENVPDAQSGDRGTIYLTDVPAVESGLSGSLKELVAGACNSYGFNSIAFIPVRLEGREAGYIQVASPRMNGVTREIVGAVESIAGHLQVVLEHAGLRGELDRRRQDLPGQGYDRSAHPAPPGERLRLEAAGSTRLQEETRVQRDLAIALNGIASMDAALKLCLDTAITASGMDSGGVYLADPVAGGFKLACARGLGEDFVKLVAFHSAAESSGRAVMRGKSLFGRYNELDTAADEAHRREGLKGVGIVPVIHAGKTVACLNVASHVFEEIPAGARGAVEAICAVLGSFLANISGREELIESEERYRDLFARTPNPVMVIDSEGNYIDGNEAALAFLECTREELLAMNVRDTLPPYLDDRWFDNLRRIWESGGTVERDYYVWGKIKVLELTVIPLQTAGRRIIFGIGRDITERKIREAALRESEWKYRALIEDAAEAIFIVQDGMIMFANRRGLESVQYSPEELAVKPFGEVICAPDGGPAMEGGAADGRIHPFKLIERDGSVKMVEVRAVPVVWEGRQAALMLVTGMGGAGDRVVDRN